MDAGSATGSLWMERKICHLFSDVSKFHLQWLSDKIVGAEGTWRSE